jgi:hypothetical protein
MRVSALHIKAYTLRPSHFWVALVTMCIQIWLRFRADWELIEVPTAESGSSGTAFELVVFRLGRHGATTPPLQYLRTPVLDFAIACETINTKICFAHSPHARLGASHLPKLLYSSTLPACHPFPLHGANSVALVTMWFLTLRHMLREPTRCCPCHEIEGFRARMIMHFLECTGKPLPPSHSIFSV